MKHVFVLVGAMALLFLTFQQSAATTIVLIRTEESVYIGADSRIVDQNGESLGTECKVMKIGDLFFANAGLGVDAVHGFNIKQIAVNSFRSTAPFEQKLQDFIAKVDDECSAYLQRIKYERTDIYERIIHRQLTIFLNHIPKKGL